ncbi:MAG: fluoride efflux transporter CrcB [Planctomycetaceae bacterium]|nr:fluoride efflux transporter CrcB [Planctomycetaceae bacterium]
MKQFLLIFIAGGCGSLMRYTVAGWAQHWSSSSFPTGTMVVNIVGCAAIGFLTPLLTGPVLIREEYRLAVLVGLLGGFTTFSTYGWETISLANDGQRWLALANVLGNNVFGLSAAWAASRLATAVYGA